MSTRDDHDDVRGLEALRDVPPPRRSEDAFVRRVQDDVARARAPRWLFVPALAAGAAALGFFVAMPGEPEQVIARAHDAGAVRPAVVDHAPEPVRDTAPAVADGTDDAPPVDLDDADPGFFSFPALDASSEQELVAFEQRLDEALGHKAH